MVVTSGLWYLLSVIIFSVLYIFCIFQVSYNDYVLFHNTEKHRLFKNPSDVLIIRMYLGIINMWEQYYWVSSSRTFLEYILFQ